jgi:ligand-binding sensor domain-containing protein
MLRRAWILIPALFLAACASLEEVAAGRAQWERIFFTPASARVLAFAEGAVIYATNQGFFSSTDTDRFRKPSSDVPGDPEIVGVATAPGISVIYAVTDVGYLLRSIDKGRSFAMIGQFPHTRITGLAMTTEARLFVATSSGVLISNEDLPGLAARRARSYLMPWETLVLGLPIWRRANLAADTDLWKDWGVVLDGNITRLVADPKDSSHLLAEIFDEGIVETWDEGENWRPVTDDLGERVKGPMAFGPDGLVMAGLFLSRDNGRTWSRTGLKPDPEDLKQSRDLVFPVHATAISRNGLWALHYRAASVYFSADGGATWHREGEPQDFRAKGRETSPAVLAVDPAGRLWVGTEGHGIYRYREAPPRSGAGDVDN